MSWLSRSFLYFRLAKELLRYDLAGAMLGFRSVRRGLRPPSSCRQSIRPDLEAQVCEAVRRIVPFYWKRVQCLQRSVITARVLRAYGAQAEIVVGYRLAPFLAHAWVEVAGRIVNDSPAFQSRLQVLERF
jgi:hypothetical protein